MKLTSIKNLYREMIDNNELRQQFDFHYNGIDADVFFFIDGQPFILAFGTMPAGRYFEIEVTQGFVVPDYFDDGLYREICIAFNIKYNPNNPHIFKPSDFWRALSPRIPQTLMETRKTTPADIVQYRNDVDEAKKIHFYGFRDNNKAGENVRNLEKTLKLMGRKAYERCKNQNLSSCWCADPNRDRYADWEKLL